MKEYVAKSIVGVAGCVLLGVGCYITQSADPIWGLILLIFLVSAVE